MKSFAAVLASCCMMLAPPVLAQSNPVVVELFTSQGCSSCPPADKILQDLSTRDDVIALALHVDYWDYIGWKDSFARAEHTDRQRGYARVSGRKMIYTPQMIVNGQEDVVGAHAMELTDLIDQHRKVAPRVSISATRTGDVLTIRAEPLSELPPSLNVVLVRYEPLQSVGITRGENSGKTLDYANVVESWDILGNWEGTSALELTANINGQEQAVVLVQNKGPGAIVAAAKVD